MYKGNFCERCYGGFDSEGNCKRCPRQAPKKHVAFSNASIKAPRKGKPHICIRQGRWRVSASKPPHYKTGKLFTDAHNFIRGK